MTSAFHIATQAGSFEQQAALIAYAARYYSTLPFQGPVVTLLKEYLPAAWPVACNELLALSQLLGGLPDEKWTVSCRILLFPPFLLLLCDLPASFALLAAVRCGRWHATTAGAEPAA